jgi:hypothetical protein
MSIQKKSLISTLKTAKKANVANAPLAHVEAGTTEVRTRKLLGKKTAKVFGKKTAKVFGKKHAKAFARSFAKVS